MPDLAKTVLISLVICIALVIVLLVYVVISSEAAWALISAFIIVHIIIFILALRQE